MGAFGGDMGKSGGDLIGGVEMESKFEQFQHLKLGFDKLHMLKSALGNVHQIAHRDQVRYSSAFIKLNGRIVTLTASKMEVSRYRGAFCEVIWGSWEAAVSK